MATVLQKRCLRCITSPEKTGEGTFVSPKTPSVKIRKLFSSEVSIFLGYIQNIDFCVNHATFQVKDEYGTVCVLSIQRIS